MVRLQGGRPGNRGSIPGNGRDSSFLHSIHTGSGTKAVSYSMITSGPFSAVQQPGSEADQ